jgi:hypothetical protein
MSLSDGQFRDLTKRLRIGRGKGGGFSISAATGNEPQVGYMVSLPGMEQQIRSQNLAPAHLKQFVAQHADTLHEDHNYFGGWNPRGNPAHTETSLDVSRNIAPKQDVADEYGDAVAEIDARTSAEDLMVAWDQEAAYDLGRDDEILNPQFKKAGRRGQPSG